MLKPKYQLLLFASILIAILITFLINRLNLLANRSVCKNCNVIIVTADSLRSDHMGCYGYGRPTTPNIDRFSRRAVLFSNVVTPSPRTTPSLVSLMTGLHPTRTGVQEIYHRLPAAISDTLAEMLQKAGYNTGAVVSNWVVKSQFSNLHRGFDYYDDEITEPELNRNYVWERRAEQTVDESINWLKGHKDDRFFFWVHFIEPHGPYYPPPRYRGRFTHEGKKLVAVKKFPDFQRLPAIPVDEKGLTDILSYVDAYDDEVLYLDEQVGRLFKFLEQNNLFDSTIVIFASDHGESFHDHNVYLEHGFEVFEDSAKIPVLLAAPPQAGISPGHTDVLASITDIYPTILELLGVEARHLADRGYSLVAPLKGRGGLRSFEFIRNNKFTQRAARDANAKYVEYSGKNITRFECYNVADDPNEQNPNGCTKSKNDELSNALKSFWEEAKKVTVRAQGVNPNSDSDFKALKSLGYL